MIDSKKDPKDQNDKTQSQESDGAPELEGTNARVHEGTDAPEPESTKAPEPQSTNIDYKDAWVRVTADYQNLKREMGEKQREYVKFAAQNLLEDLIPVIEHFHQGLKWVPEEIKSQEWMKGFDQIKKQLDDFMSRNGLERIETVGQMFDPQLHEAVSSRSEEGSEEGVVLEEVMGGYKLNGKVIQAAKVVVAE